jgi:hypothetical protein
VSEYLIVLKQLFQQATRRDRQRFWVGSAIVLLVLPWVVGSVGGNYWVRVLDFALLYVVLALGLNVVIGFAAMLYWPRPISPPNFLRLPHFFLQDFIFHCGAHSSSLLA